MSKIQRRDHQQACIAAINTEFETESRASAIMACATGKTLTQAFLIEDQIDAGAKRIFSYAPSIDLLYQTAKEYRSHLGDSVPIYVVCSEEERLEAETDAPSTDGTLQSAEEIRSAMQASDGPAIFLSSYQSADKLSEAQRLESGEILAADLGIADEAHRTAGGKIDSAFAHMLFNSNTAINKRAFFTATPRATSEGRVSSHLISMSDRKLYGRRVYDFSYSQALKAGLVSDYDVWVPIITQDEVAAFMAKRGLGEHQLRNAIGEIAITQVMEQTGQTRGVTFHNSIEASQNFATQLGEGLQDKNIPVEHVDGQNMNRQQRQKKLAILNEDAGFVTNAKIMSEGVNYPGIQIVAMMDKTESLIRVIQSVSRSLRIDKDRDPNKVASIVVPVMVKERTVEAVMEAAQNQGFSEILSITDALRHSDNTFDADIRRKSVRIGRGEEDAPQLDKIKIPGLHLNDAERTGLLSAVRTATMREIAHPFSVRVGQVQAFLAENGRLPNAEDDPRLSAWIKTQRENHKDGRLFTEDAQMLDETPGWSWLPENATAKTVAHHLVAYADRRRTPPPFEPDRSRMTGEGELANIIFDADSASLRDSVSPARSRLSPAMAGKVATLLNDHARKTGDTTISKTIPQGISQFERGRFQFIADSAGKEHIHFFPERSDVSFFDTGHHTAWKFAAPRGIRMEGLDPDQREVLTALSSLRHSVRFQMAPVREKTGQYSRDRAAFGAIDHSSLTVTDVDLARRPASVMDKVTAQAVLMRHKPAPVEHTRPVKPTSDVETAFSVSPVQPQARAKPATPQKIATPTQHLLWGRFLQTRNPDGSTDTRFYVSEEDSRGTQMPAGAERGIQIAGLTPDHQAVLDRLPRGMHSLAANLDVLPAGKGSLAKEAIAHVASISTDKIRRTNEPEKIVPQYVIHRLEERRLANLPPYSAKNLKAGLFDPNAEVTTLTEGAAKITNARMRQCIETMQVRHLEGKTKPEEDRMFDRAPGFSWLETDKLAGRLARTVGRLASRHGENVLSSHQARQGDNGLANTLKVVDAVVANADRYPDARDDLAALSRNKTISHFVSYARHRSLADDRTPATTRKRADDPIQQ